VDGANPNGKRDYVTDAKLVNAALPAEGWVRLVYDFGCGFIHLSDKHDHHARDPYRALPYDERQQLADYLRKYHGGDASPDSSFADLIEYLPKVMDKISRNLEIHLKYLEEDQGLQR
jgi:hypothetical protein